MKPLFYEWWPSLPCPPREGIQRHEYGHHARCRDKKRSRLYVQLGCPPVRYARLCDAYPEWTEENARDTPSKKLLNYDYTQSIAPLTESMIFSTLVQYIGRIAQIVLAALTIKLVTNFLSVNNYGVYATISEYALFFSVAANLGIFATTVRQMSVNPTDGKTFINAL